MEAVALQQLTYREFREMEFDDDDPFQYELLDGELVKKSAPSPWHQDLSGNLYITIRQHLTEKKLGGKVFYSPIDVFLNDYNAPQPDLVFVSEARKGIVTHDGILGVPDLVIEIISPSSIRRDRFDKRTIYERFAIPEYWIADPQNQEIEVYVLNASGRYDAFCIATAQDISKNEGFLLTSKALPELQIDVRTLF